MLGIGRLLGCLREGQVCFLVTRFVFLSDLSVLRRVRKRLWNIGVFQILLRLLFVVVANFVFLNSQAFSLPPDKQFF